MKPMRGIGPSPRVLACKDAKSESNFVVRSVNEMIEKGELTPSSTVAMIYRTNAQSRLLEEACVQHNLRYVVRGSTGTFYKRAEIQDSLSFLKIMYNDRDRSAWARAVKAPSKGIGETSLNEFFNYCDAVAERYAIDHGITPPSPMDVLFSLVHPEKSDITEILSPTEFLSTRSINRFTPFASSLSVLKEKMTSQTVNEFLLSVIEDLNLKSHFDVISKTRDEYEDRLSNVMELVRAADRYKDDGPCMKSEIGNESESPLERFLDDVALIADIEPSSDEEDLDDKRIVANLMTIHSSKGMEFDAVL
jgi:DNA helicase-2/ATP-dependent DNA helicase PcrA